jgi:hypothetical protein
MIVGTESPWLARAIPTDLTSNIRRYYSEYPDIVFPSLADSAVP